MAAITGKPFSQNREKGEKKEKHHFHYQFDKYQKPCVMLIADRIGPEEMEFKEFGGGSCILRLTPELEILGYLLDEFAVLCQEFIIK